MTTTTADAIAEARGQMRAEYERVVATLDRRDRDLAQVDATFASHTRAIRRTRDRKLRLRILREFNVEGWRIQAAARYFWDAGVISAAERAALIERSAVKE